MKFQSPQLHQNGRIGNYIGILRRCQKEVCTVLMAGIIWTANVNYELDSPFVFINCFISFLFFFLKYVDYTIYLYSF